MTLPLIASVDQLEARTGEDYDESGPDFDRATAALQDASDLARHYAGNTWVDEDSQDSTAPPVVVGLVLKSAKRALENPEGFLSETDGDYTYRRDDETLGDWVYFTEPEQEILQSLGGKRKGLFTVTTTRRAHPCRCGWVPTVVDSEGNPVSVIPWYGGCGCLY